MEFGASKKIFPELEAFVIDVALVLFFTLCSKVFDTVIIHRGARIVSKSLGNKIFEG
jgi:hypothetical protein